MKTTLNTKPLEVLIVGAGLSGLNCARILENQGISYHIIEASDSIGGRIKTDRYQGFLLDRGFQMLLTAYPETKKTLSFEELNLKPLVSGALVQSKRKRHRVVHPGRHPTGVLTSALSPLASLHDKYRGSLLAMREVIRSAENIFQENDVTTTAEFLKDWGFSERFQERFLRPFFAGVFLENELTTSSQFFEFMYQMFILGQACLPDKGMKSIPKQLFSDLQESQISFNKRVVRLIDQGVELEGGERLYAKQIVLAVDLPNAKKLLSLPERSDDSKSSCTIYFAAPSTPVQEPILILNGEGEGLINNIIVPNLAAPRYAPKGYHLISVNSVGIPNGDERETRHQALKQARDWFGSQVDQWEHLRTYRIPHALPVYMPHRSGVGLNATSPEWLSLAGDYLETPSIEGAIRSGRRTAEDLVRKIKGTKSDLLAA